MVITHRSVWKFIKLTEKRQHITRKYRLVDQIAKRYGYAPSTYWVISNNISDIRDSLLNVLQIWSSKVIENNVIQ